MTQKSFLDPGYMPPVRRTDPAPSQEAAVALQPKLAGLREEAFRRAVALCERYGDATANEIGYLNFAVEGPQRSESLRKRVRELVDGGFLIVSGERICRQSGSKVTAYKVKP